MDLVWGVWGIPTPKPEYRFHPTRKWRFDYAWPFVNGKEAKIALEIEGGIWSGGRHTRGRGYIDDMEKYNEAARLGWRVFRFQPKDLSLKSGKAQTYMKDVFTPHLLGPHLGNQCGAF